MNNIAILSAFNSHILEFVEDIQKVFPEDEDIETTKNSLLAFKKTNPKLLIRIWKEQIAIPYRVQIQKGDISFFIEKDYSYDISDCDASGSIINKISSLRQPVRNMGKPNQEKAIKYIQNLTKLTDLYN